MDKTSSKFTKFTKFTLLVGDPLDAFQYAIDHELPPSQWRGIQYSSQLVGFDRRKCRVVRVGPWWATQAGWRLANEVNRWLKGKQQAPRAA